MKRSTRFVFDFQKFSELFTQMANSRRDKNHLHNGFQGFVANASYISIRPVLLLAMKKVTLLCTINP